MDNIIFRETGSETPEPAQAVQHLHAPQADLEEASHRPLGKDCANARICQAPRPAVQRPSGRSQSRLRNLLPNGTQLVQLIIDGLDHSKTKVPRLPCLVSKDYSSFNRPTLDLTRCLAHLFAVYLFPSLPFVPKDSNLMSDVLMHVLHSLAEGGLDLRSVDLRLQSDNTSRECKNNCVLRCAAGLVGLSRVKRFQLQNLDRRTFARGCRWILRILVRSNPIRYTPTNRTVVRRLL